MLEGIASVEADVRSEYVIDNVQGVVRAVMQTADGYGGTDPLQGGDLDGGLQFAECGLDDGDTGVVRCRIERTGL